MPARHSLTFRVRYSECDPMGVAHHSAYAPWLEMGRTELLRQSGNGLDYRTLEQQGVFMAVVRLEIRYKRPARYDDVLELRWTAGAEVASLRVDLRSGAHHIACTGDLCNVGLPSEWKTSRIFLEGLGSPETVKLATALRVSPPQSSVRVSTSAIGQV